MQNQHIGISTLSLQRIVTVLQSQHIDCGTQGCADFGHIYHLLLGFDVARIKRFVTKARSCATITSPLGAASLLVPYYPTLASLVELECLQLQSPGVRNNTICHL
jgi:hypothetical protein